MTRKVIGNFRGRLMRVIGRESDFMDYGEAKRMASDPDVGIRSTLAGRRDVQPEILYFLAGDSVAEVRRRIAANSATPVQADLLLSRDRDDDVRNELATKVATLAPRLTAEQRDRVGDMIVEILKVLAEDELPRVRRILSEALKDADNVPREVIERLARDREVSVAGPVLQHSPLLADEILLEIIDSAPVQGVLEAIARRDRLEAPVSDAIVASEDTMAITALLANTSAQIREETLDDLVEHSAGITAWHAALVDRPLLSPRAICKLAEIVADSLVRRLQARSDIDADTAQRVSTAVRHRLSDEAGGGKTGDTGTPPSVRAKLLNDAEQLDEDAFTEALGKGDSAFLTAALALRADVPAALIEKIISLASAKGMTAICWKAGLGMALCEQLQLRLSRIKPSNVLRASSGGSYPLTPDEMAWQLEFFGV